MNPLALFFTPGIGFGGLLIGGPAGAQSALAAWLLLIGAASVWTLLRLPKNGSASPTARF